MTKPYGWNGGSVGGSRVRILALARIFHYRASSRSDLSSCYCIQDNNSNEMCIICLYVFNGLPAKFIMSSFQG